MKLVLVESPFASPDPATRIEYLAFARACLRDCLERGEAPFASHLLYTQPGVLDDDSPTERALGIEAGLAWGNKAELTVVYKNFGISPGMAKGIERAKKDGRPIEYRTLRMDCHVCGGGGFSGRETGYDDVCSNCGGTRFEEWEFALPLRDGLPLPEDK
jgi:hypothetical protein